MNFRQISPVRPAYSRFQSFHISNQSQRIPQPTYTNSSLSYQPYLQQQYIQPIYTSHNNNVQSYHPNYPRNHSKTNIKTSPSKTNLSAYQYNDIQQAEQYYIQLCSEQQKKIQNYEEQLKKTTFNEDLIERIKILENEIQILKSSPNQSALIQQYDDQQLNNQIVDQNDNKKVNEIIQENEDLKYKINEVEYKLSLATESLEQTKNAIYEMSSQGRNNEELNWKARYEEIRIKYLENEERVVFLKAENQDLLRQLHYMNERIGSQHVMLRSGEYGM